jgi:hypothetical protein
MFPEHIYSKPPEEPVKSRRYVIKPYKLSRLRYSQHNNKVFRSLWNCTDPTLKKVQYEYKICTHLWLLRFNQKDVENVMMWWYRQNAVHSDFRHMRNVIMRDTYLFTQSQIKKDRHEEYLRRKARKAESAKVQQ